MWVSTPSGYDFYDVDHNNSYTTLPAANPALSKGTNAIVTAMIAYTLWYAIPLGPTG
jgi:hypothetical protein